jgi:hypothetical protein
VLHVEVAERDPRGGSLAPFEVDEPSRVVADTPAALLAAPLSLEDDPVESVLDDVLSK